MTIVNKIIFNNFRNFSELEILFNQKSNILYGINGSGKTNILEGISLITKGRGLRGSSYENFIKNKSQNFIINALLSINENNYDVKITTELSNNKLKKNVLLNNDKSSESMKFLNSSLSFIFFLPEMERLFLSSPLYRRNFIDRIIFSGRNEYNRLINQYKKNLTERSKILLTNQFDNEWIQVIESKISELGLEIYKLRNIQLEILNQQLEILNKKNKYNFDIVLKIKDSFYEKGLNYDSYTNSIKECRIYDKKFGGLKLGPHKSDITAVINNDYAASLLSTGQQKTIVLMILIAQCNFLIKDKKIKPILLLDEICSHLDSFNRKLLLDMINQFDIQFFLTGTDRKLFSFISTNVNFYNINEL